MSELMRVRARLSRPLGRRVTAPIPTPVALFGGLRAWPWRMDPDEGVRELAAYGLSPSFQPGPALERRCRRPDFTAPP